MCRCHLSSGDDRIDRWNETFSPTFWSLGSSGVQLQYLTWALHLTTLGILCFRDQCSRWETGNWEWELEGRGTDLMYCSTDLGPGP